MNDSEDRQGEDVSQLQIDSWSLKLRCNEIYLSKVRGWQYKLLSIPHYCFDSLKVFLMIPPAIRNLFFVKFSTVNFGNFTDETQFSLNGDIQVEIQSIYIYFKS